MKRMLLAVLFVPQLALGATGSVTGSKHDLSVVGPGPIRAESETQVCAFCHIPHSGGEKLSGRPDQGADRSRPYESTTERRRAGVPGGASRFCLSCHDGTVAVGDTRRDSIRVGGTTGGRIPAQRPSNVGTDLRRSHPISVAPERAGKTGLALQGLGTVQLDPSGQVQCTTCHDPHSEFAGGPEGKFLRTSIRGGALCAECHEVNRGASHSRSTASFGAAQGNRMGFTSVADAGCSACHRSHAADVRGRLLARGDAEDDDVLCLRCHDGTVARLDIGRDLSKPSSHRFAGGQHDASEGPTNARHRLPEASAATQRHAVCVDCHDPHAATDRDAAMAPLASGPIAGAWGIDQGGALAKPALNQYEICFKCHGDSANQPIPSQMGGLSAPRRAAEDANLRRVFGADAPSSHPVLGARAGVDVPSLLSPWTAASVLFCTDCHASDQGPGAGGTGARGPHGSIYPRLLERNYSTADATMESAESYALCYKCHDRSILLSEKSAFRFHRKHVVDQGAPCSACHAAHGVSSRRGTPTNNAHLIDFDLSIVRVGATLPAYTTNGRRSGSCTLQCHVQGSTGIHESRAY